MSERAYDCLIVGQGLAGTTLAWHLIQRGVRVLVVDRELTSTASRVAAGLMTPLTGKRFAVTDNWHDYRQPAAEFYRRIEKETRVACFEECPAMRWAKNAAEQQKIKERAVAGFRSLAELITSDGKSPGTALGGIVMPTAARLDVTRYLDASREWFRQHQSYVCGRVDPESLSLDLDGKLLVRSLNVIARLAIYCVGYDSAPALQHGLPFNPAKGETLRVRIPDYKEQRVTHRGIWLVPEQGDEFLVGATYDRERLDTEPTAEGRAALLKPLAQLISSSAERRVEVISHQAAVRPVLSDRQPVARFLKESQPIGIFNGLGSKGTLTAPAIASRFADEIACRLPRP